MLILLLFLHWVFTGLSDQNKFKTLIDIIFNIWKEKNRVPERTFDILCLHRPNIVLFHFIHMVFVFSIEVRYTIKKLIQNLGECALVLTRLINKCRSGEDRFLTENDSVYFDSHSCLHVAHSTKVFLCHELSKV